jgi:hypothetical protein
MPLPVDSPFRDPWQLSYARCQAVLGFLLQHGIPPERLRLSQAGVYEPLPTEKGRESLAQQERVEVRLLNEVAQDWPTPTDPKQEKPTAATKKDHGHDDHAAEAGHGKNASPAKDDHGHAAGGH